MSFLLCSACTVQLPNGVFSCFEDTECPSTMFCHSSSSRCFDTPDVCVPTRACDDQIFQCGTLDDGCGTELNCGDCEAPEACGGGGNPFSCGCEPATCASAGAECGFIPTGCGMTFVDCGGNAPCAAIGPSYQCNGQNRCECVPTPVDCMGRCGQIWNGCAMVECGGCEQGFSCSQANVCLPGQCTPVTIECPEAFNCGAITDECGDLVYCNGNLGQCAAGETCRDNVCDCVPRNCIQLGQECGGPYPDGCGGVVICGDCENGEQCGNWDSSTRFTCGGCSCEDLGYECSDEPVDLCGAEVSCGVCTQPGERCIDLKCSCVDPFDEGTRNDTLGNATELPDATSADYRREVVATLDSEADEDWYSTELSTLTTFVTVEVAPENGSAIPIEVYSGCRIIECFEGSPIAAPSGVRVGCRAADGDVEMQLHCASNSTPMLTVRVGLPAMAGTVNACRPYRLRIEGDLLVIQNEFIVQPL